MGALLWATGMDTIVGAQRQILNGIGVEGLGGGGWLERLGVTFDIDEELISCQCTRAATSLSRILDAGNEGKLTAEGVRGTPPQPPPTLRCLSAAPAATLT